MLKKHKAEGGSDNLKAPVTETPFVSDFEEICLGVILPALSLEEGSIVRTEVKEGETIEYRVKFTHEVRTDIKALFDDMPDHNLTRLDVVPNEEYKGGLQFDTTREDRHTVVHFDGMRNKSNSERYETTRKVSLEIARLLDEHSLATE